MNEEHGVLTLNQSIVRETTMPTNRGSVTRNVRIGAALALVVVVVVALATQFSATSYASLRDTLRAQGATVQEEGPGAQPFLRGADHRLSLNGAGVDVFEYRTTLEASLDTGRISADGSTIGSGFFPFGGAAAAINFVATPHWFHAGRVLALYVGHDAGTLTLLRTALGPQIAGG